MASEAEQSLLFRLRAEASGVNTGTSEAKAAVTALRTHFGSELGQMSHASESAFHELSRHISEYVSESLPAIGPLHVRLVEHLHGISEEAKTVSPELKKVTASIAELSQLSGKSTSEISDFLKTYIGIKTVSEQNAAAINFFGGQVDAFTGETLANFTPQLKQAEAEMVALGSTSEATGASLASMAGPIAIATIAFLALVAVEYEFIKASVEAAEKAADFGGEMERASIKTGLTVEQLVGLRVLADENKVSFEQLTTGLARYLRNAELAKEGNKGLSEEFQKLGIDIKNITSPQDAIRELFRAIEKEGPDAFARNETAIKLLSRAGIDLIPVLVKMGGELDNATNKGKELLGFTTADAKASAELEEKIADLKNAALGLSLAFGKAATPEVLEFSRELTETLTRNKESITAVLGVTGLVLQLISGPLQEALDTVNVTLRDFAPEISAVKAGLDLAATAYDIAAAAARAYAEAVHLVKPEDVDQNGIPAVGEGKGEATPSLKSSAPPTDKANREKDLVDLKAAAIAIKETTQKQIDDAKAQRAVGAISRAEESKEIAAAFEQRLAALAAYINGERSEKEKEYKDAAGDLTKQVKIQTDIRTLDQSLQSEKDTAQKAQADSQRAAQEDQRKETVEHAKRMLAIEVQNSQDRLKLSESLERLGLKTAQELNADRDKEEKHQLQKREDTLKTELNSLGQYATQRKGIEDQLKAIGTERTNLEEAQSNRRKELAAKESADKIKLAQLERDGTEKVREIADRNETERLQAEVKARIRSAQDAAIQITAIELAANSRAQRELKAQLKEVPDEIKDPVQRVQKEKQLNNQLKELEEERKGIEQKGVSDRKAGEQEDLDNLTKYNDAYAALRGIELTIDEEIERTRLSLLRATHASQLDILNQELAEREAAENKRNAAELRRIDHERDVALKAAKGLDDEKTKIHEITTKHDLLLEKEKNRHDRAMGLITAEGKEGKGEIAKAPVSAFDQLSTAINENLSGSKLTEATAGLEAMKTAFSELGQAVGQVVHSFVLYGTAGTSVRKVTAEILASIAQQAAVKAVFELAEGFAALALAYFGMPNAGPSASAHFAAAAIYGSIAGIAAVVGRQVAGDSFKDKPAATGSTGAGSSSSSSGSVTKPNTIDIGRRQGAPSSGTGNYAHIIEFKVKGDVVAEHFARDYMLNGKTRIVISSDGQLT